MNISIFKFTLSKFASSSAPVFPAVRIKSPKSDNTYPGIVVSKSITHKTLPFSSKSILLTLVSQCVMRLGNIPSLCNLSALHISSARTNNSSTNPCAFSKRPALLFFIDSLNVSKRNSILWNFGIVSPNC